MSEGSKAISDEFMSTRSITRRRILQRSALGVTGIALASLLAACGASPGNTPAPAVSAAPTPAAAASSAPAASASPASSVAPVAATRTAPTTAIASTQQPSAAPAAGKPGGRLIVGMNMEPDMLDQHVGSSRYNEFVTINIYDRLIEQATDGSYKPGLAESFERSVDGMSLTLKLRKGVTFHDDTPFNAEAVKANFDRIANPATKSQKAVGLLGPYAGTEVVDEFTAKVTMKQPYGPLIDALSSHSLVMQSPTAMAKSGADYGQHPVGTGPFIFKEWIQKDHITLVRNPKYAWASGVAGHSGVAYLDELRFRFLPEDATRVTTLDTGETDLIINLPPAEFGRFSKDTKFSTINSPVLGLPPSLMLNTERAPMDDPKVRMAVGYAIDRAALIEAVFYGVYKSADSPLTSFNRYYDKSVGTLAAFDQQKAKALLTEAGWAAGSGGIRAKNGQPLRLIYISLPGGTNVQTAELVQSQLRDVGIDVEIRQLSNPANLAASQAGDHHIRWLNWLFGDASELSTTFSSKNIGTGWNFCRWKNAELDGLLDQGRTEVDETKRVAIYSKVQQIAMQNALLAPLYIGAQVIAMKANVKGVRMHPLGDTAIFQDTYLA